MACVSQSQAQWHGGIVVSALEGFRSEVLLINTWDSALFVSPSCTIDRERRKTSDSSSQSTQA